MPQESDTPKRCYKCPSKNAGKVKTLCSVCQLSESTSTFAAIAIVRLRAKKKGPNKRSLDETKQEVQVAIFMASIGQLAQKIYKTFKLNEGEENKLQELKGKFNEYFTPKLNYTVERYQFNNIKQCNEPFKELLTKVKLQAKKDELIKDRIVVGIQNNDVREKLLSDPDLNITKAIQICVAAENANAQLREIKDRNENEPSISTIERKISRDFSQKAFNPRDTTSFKKLINNCTRCGAKHEINKCPAYGKVCHKWKKANHFSKLCKTAKRERVVNLVEDTEVESDEFSLSINGIKTRNGQEWLERVTFKGNQTEIKQFKEPDERFSTVHIDLIGPFPPSNEYVYCLTCIDRFTGWIEAIPIRNETAETVARAFYEGWITRFGVPYEVITDQGRQFTSELFKTLATLCG
ncbi:hypothetical protein LAZ67_2000102 [Cordylochernes scorpioides]|uniref:Integrase catalytic domain-containing protein n=1 Tax=Cordylochernes scorpioides TaxID=51811 RepID=A0ABY6K062_9ARAC|nr:hypothetical protein LAZ67_2000102 [Cordylochernes scorpioides]